MARVALVGSVIIATLAGVQSGAGAGPAGAAPPRGAAPACTWTPQVLPQLPGGSFAEIYGTDGGNRWVGEADDSTFTAHAALWRNGRLTDLGTPLGNVTVARDVNRHGIVVGDGATASPDTTENWSHALMWRTGVPGRPRAIRLAEPAGTITSQATGINDAGLIVGSGYVEVNGSRSYHPLVWSAATPGRVRDLGTPPNTSTLLNGVSETGRIVATRTDVFLPGNTSTALAGTLRSGLHALPPSGLQYTDARAIAGRWIGGWVLDPSLGDWSAPVRWENGRPVMRPDLFGIVVAINSRGTALISSSGDAAVWTADGALTQLSSPAGGSLDGYAIAEDGTVGGWSRFASSTEPTLWSCG